MSENATKINISQWSEGGSIPKKLIKIYWSILKDKLLYGIGWGTYIHGSRETLQIVNAPEYMWDEK